MKNTVLTPLILIVLFVSAPAQARYADGMNLHAGYFAMHGALDPMGQAIAYPEEEIPLEPLPDPNASEGSAFTGLNFAGPGWRYTAYTRPVSTWDLISKVHDFSYEVNRLSFFRDLLGGDAGDGDAMTEENRASRQAKADYIFREMASATSDERSFWESTLNAGSQLVFRGADRSSFKECDYFYNILTDDGLDFPTYLMIPWDALPEEEQDIAQEAHPNPSRLGRLLQPYDRRGLYSHEVPSDREVDWRQWLKEKLGAGLWDSLAEIDDMTGSD